MDKQKMYGWVPALLNIFLTIFLISHFLMSLFQSCRDHQTFSREVKILLYSLGLGLLTTVITVIIAFVSSKYDKKIW